MHFVNQTYFEEAAQLKVKNIFHQKLQTVVVGQFLYVDTDISTP